MKTSIVRALAMSAVFALALTSCSKSNQGVSVKTGCNRTCLLGLVDQYVAALLQHDPSKAPFSPDARYTENAQQLKLGDGLWNTASAGPTTYKLVEADPSSHQAAFYMLMKENGNPIWLAGRLQENQYKITQLEVIAVRKGASGFGNFDSRSPSPAWGTEIPKAQRLSRDKLTDIANKYFDAIQNNLTNSVPFAADCDRHENGVETTNNKSLQAPDGSGKSSNKKAPPNVGAMNCTDNINSMMWRYITKIEPRRFPVVDPTHGIVFAIAMFQQPGTVASTDIPGYGKYVYPDSIRHPFTTDIAEMFKVNAQGKIERIEATMVSLPYGSQSGWGL